MVLVIATAYTSQECNLCGHAAAENRKTQAMYRCVACGHTENAHRKAAKAVLRRGLGMLASGSPCECSLD